MAQRFAARVAAGLLLAALGVGMAQGQTSVGGGAAKLLTASWIGGAGNDEFIGCTINPDGTIVLAGNSGALTMPGVRPVALGDAGGPAPTPRGKPDKNAPAPNASGVIVRLSADGSKALGLSSFGPGVTITKLKTDAKGNLYLLGNAPGGLKGASGTGAFVAALPPDASRLAMVAFCPGASDFGVDANGEFVVLTGAKMTRYSADGKTPKWTATWSAYGGNTPGAMVVSPDTGIAAVVGYGMTHTGHEPYKDPYGYGFDRAGKQVWAIWNPDPKKEASSGNGLMADTTGHAASVGVDGRIYFMLFADGGNSVCSRDPKNVDEKLDAGVFAGVFQNSPGFGFKGASKTSVIFRIDSAKGVLEKGTWMCAWLTPGRANGLAMDAAAADAKGHTFVAGGSASGCPTKDPWFTAPEGGYHGDGFLAIFDKEFRMRQCGYFPGTTIHSVAARNGVVVIAGKAKSERKAGDPATPGGGEITYPVPTVQPLQPKFGGGDDDGWYAVFKLND